MARNFISRVLKTILVYFKENLIRIVFEIIIIGLLSFWVQERIRVAGEEPDIEILGAVPVHLKTEKKKNNPWSGFTHDLAFIFKLENNSSTNTKVHHAAIEGCIRIDPQGADVHLPQEDRVTYPISIDSVSKIYESRRNAVRRISIYGLVGDENTVRGHDISYIGVVFPFFQGGAYIQREGTVSIDGNCEEIRIAHPAPSFFDLFEWRIKHIGQRPMGLAEGFYNGQVKIILWVGSKQLTVDSNTIKSLKWLPYREWSDSPLSLIYERTGDFYRPSRKRRVE